MPEYRDPRYPPPDNRGDLMKGLVFILAFVAVVWIFAALETSGREACIEHLNEQGYTAVSAEDCTDGDGPYSGW